MKERVSSWGRPARAIGAGVLAVACTGGAGEKAAEPDPARAALSKGNWTEALELCGGSADASSPTLAPDGSEANGCEPMWCRLIARTMLWVDDFSDVLLPRYGNSDPTQLAADPKIMSSLVHISNEMDALSQSVAPVLGAGCEYEVASVPFRFGDASDPLVKSEIRGTWTPADAAFIGASVDSLRYIFRAVQGQITAEPPPPGEVDPPLPEPLSSVRDRIAAMDQWVHAHPSKPDSLRGGWQDRNGNGRMDSGDTLSLDVFDPGTNKRTFDFHDATPVDHDVRPIGAFTATKDLPPARCGYKKWHIDTLFDQNVGTTDGMSFSPDGSKLAFPMQVNGTYQVHLADADGRNASCLTCDHPSAWNDGVRFRPGHPDTLVFISTRDHPHSVGGAGGGFGQELYAMRSDGSTQTRLTTSGAWATNYHANFSRDGSKLVWGSTQNRTWDVMVADFVDDAKGFHLENVRHMVRDTTWWETHDFSLDGTKLLTTNTRAGWQMADLYMVDVATGALTRLTDDPAWDEHGHLSPDGRKISWISARWQPASVDRMTDGTLAATYDFYWIGPAIFFNFMNPPVGFATELTLMDADGSNITRLTTDGDVCADNQWSPDATKIVFRQTPTATKGSAKLRVLTFDDCG